MQPGPRGSYPIGISWGGLPTQTSDTDVALLEVDETEVDEILDAVVLDELLDSDIDETVVDEVTEAVVLEELLDSDVNVYDVLVDPVVDVSVAVVYIHNSTVGVCIQSITMVPFTPWLPIVSWIVDVRLVVSFINESKTLSAASVSVPSTSTL